MYRVSSRVHTVLVTLRLALMIQVPAQGARSDLRSLHTDLRLFLFALSVILLVSCVVNVRSGELTQTTRRVAERFSSGSRFAFVCGVAGFVIR